ncbi:hypothetical protein [Actinophytocola xinjiangensis]|uniref:hypothetical protein n=1 Tax=Actinophytocola xinjiangensis TaxID=485602 RepID=UPI000AC25783|nr:hypothetical protein [Actinophytocola xinjiangensis]
MPRDDVMSTPIFDELLREMAKRAEPETSETPGSSTASEEPARPVPSPPPRRRHRAE